MRRLNRVMTVVAKIGEILCWIAAAANIVISIFILTGRTLTGPEGTQISLGIIDQSRCELDLNGFSMLLTDLASEQDVTKTLVIFAVTGLIVSGLMAMVFRNIYLSFRTAEGKTGFAKGSTPFQPSIVRMIREIGFFCIAPPIVELIMSAVARGIIDAKSVETSVSLEGVILGLVVLCLAQFFAYGVQLQQDTDGLV